MKIISTHHPAVCNCMLWKWVEYKSKPMSAFMVTPVLFYLWMRHISFSNNFLVFFTQDILYIFEGCEIIPQNRFWGASE